ncbi:MAG: hypothetical protein K0R92_1601 [Lachnospiraceae bacterium]|jgi:LysM repeat protein|nr:hypothetical protein [Lachnospiraceae bacterium]
MNYEDYNCMVYIIRQGDTLYSISRRYNVPLASILRANPFVDIYNLRIGEEICIPVLTPVNMETLMEHVVEEGETMQSILMMHGIEVEDILLNNRLEDIFLLPGTTIMIPSVPSFNE